MLIAIRDINFESRAISVEIASYSKTRHERLRRYVQFCTEMGYENLSVYHPSALSGTELTRLKRFAKKHRITIAPADPPEEVPASGPSSNRFKLTSSYASTAPQNGFDVAHYNLRCLTLEGVLEVTKHFIMLVGTAIPLNSTLLSRTRLGIYELAVNSIEHGTFLDAVPQIEIDLRITPDRVSVAYKDNATLFRTDNRKKVSIDKQIKTHSKRGLGLAMIAKMFADLRFTRRGKWNCTTFTLDGHDLVEHTKHRRHTMQDFSVEVIPHKSKDTVVLKPKGSVDSMTTPMLESRFNEAMKNQQYRIVVDLSETDFISSAGLGLILGTVATLRENGGDLILMKIPKEVADTFEIMSVEDYFQTIDSLEDLAVTRS